MSAVPAPSDRLSNPDALLSRTDLRALGLERRAVDAVFRALPVIVLPGYSRPLVRVADYVELLQRSTFNGESLCCLAPKACTISRYAVVISSVPAMFNGGAAAGWVAAGP